MINNNMRFREDGEVVKQGLQESSKEKTEIKEVEQTEDLNPKQEKEISNTASKVAALITEQGFKIDDKLISDDGKLEKMCKNIEAKYSINISRKKIVIAAIEQIYNEQGNVFPGSLEKRYIDLVVEDVQKEIDKGREVHEVMKEMDREWKKKGLYISQEVSKKLKA